MPTKAPEPTVVTYKKADSEKALSTHKALSTRTKNEVEKLTIDSQESYDKAVEKLAQVKKYLKDLEKQRKTITDPLEKAKKATIALFKPTQLVFEATQRILSQGILDYRKEQERIEAAKQAELEKQLESGDIDFDEAMEQAVEAPQQEKTTTTKWGGVTVRTIKDIEILDITQIPKEYFELNMSRLRADALGNKAQNIDPIEIPGVKVIEKESV